MSSEEAAGFLLAKYLMAQGVPVVVYDPTASRDPLIALTGSLSLASSVTECITDADVIVIATPCDEFRQIPVDELARQSTPRILIDCWRILDPKRYARVAEYVPLGIGP